MTCRAVGRGGCCRAGNRASRRGGCCRRVRDRGAVLAYSISEFIQNRFELVRNDPEIK